MEKVKVKGEDRLFDSRNSKDNKTPKRKKWRNMLNNGLFISIMIMSVNQGNTNNNRFYKPSDLLQNCTQTLQFVDIYTTHFKTKYFSWKKTTIIGPFVISI